MYLFLSLSVLIKSETLQLSEDNFDSVVFNNSGKNILIEFWNPWCTHCANFRPTWDELTNDESLKESILFADVNCNQDKSICDKYKIDGTPTILYFPNETKSQLEYPGSLNLADIKTFIHKQLQFPVVFVDSYQDVERSKSLTNASSIFYLKTDITQESIISDFKSVAEQVRTSNARFFVTQSNKTEIGVFRDEGDPIIFNNNELLLDFVQKYKDPILPPLSGVIFDDMKSEKKVGLVFYISKDEDRKIFTPMINSLPSNITYSYFQYSNTDHLCHFMRITMKDLPMPLLANFSANKWKKYKGELNVEKITSWINASLLDKKWDGPGDGIFASFWIQIYGIATLPLIVQILLSILVAVFLGILGFIVFDSIRMCNDDNMKLE